MGKYVLFILLSFTSVAAYAQPDWHLKREEDGIKVYTATIPNSDFKTIKVECTINATLTQLCAFLIDIDKQPQWVFNIKTVKLVKKIAPNEFIFYSEVSVPWPCTDRDYIAHFLITQTTPKSITIDSHAEPELLPEKDGIIRVKKSIAHWDVTEVRPGVLNTVYTVEFDPSGSIPAWLTNLFVTKGPFQTFQNIRTEVSKPVYQQAHVDFIKE